MRLVVSDYSFAYDLFSVYKLNSTHQTCGYQAERLLFT